MAKETKIHGNGAEQVSAAGREVERAMIAADGTVATRQSLGALQSVDVADVDLLLGFANGAYVVIPNGALGALDTAPTAVVFGDARSTLDSLFKRVGATAPAKAGSLRLVSENIDAEKPPAAPDSAFDEPPAVAPPAPPAPMVKVSAGAFATAMTAGAGKGNGTGEGPGEVPAVVENLAPVQPTVFPQGKRLQEQQTTKTAEEILAALGLGAIPTFSQNLYTSAQFKVTPSGRSDLPLGAYDAGASSDQLATRASPVAQAAREVIQGTSGNDSIDHNALFSNGVTQWSKVLHLTFNNFSTISDIEIVANAANIALIPGFNFTGVGVTRASGNTWTIAPNPDMYANGLDVNIVYNVADSGGPVDFGVDITVTGNTGPLTFPVTNNLDFTWRDASTQADFTAFNSSGTPLMVLPRSGVGVEAFAGDGDDLVKTGAGADLIHGEAGNDTIYAGTGNDLVDGGLGADALDGGQGSDTATYANAALGVTATLDASLGVVNTNEAAGDTYTNIENLAGSQFGDILIGDAAANTLAGGDGDDRLIGRGSGDALDGGAGNDTASYEHATGDIIASLALDANGRPIGGSQGEADGDAFISIENLTGGAGSDLLTGDAGANTLDGGAGNDTLDGGGGADALIGGAGNDTATYAGATQGTVAKLTTVFAHGDISVANTNDAAGDTFSGIENLTGGNQADTLIGDAAANTLAGGADDDVLEGMAGADVLNGGLGTDTASYNHAAAGVVSSLTTSFTAGLATPVVQSGNAAGDTYSAIENLVGSDFADTLIGNNSDNVLSGGLGGDTLEGMGGADSLVGNVSGSDTASYIHATSYVRASLTAGLAGFVAEGHAGGDTYASIENLVGSDYGDVLIGDGVINTLTGGGGDDVLEGLGGGDLLYGGSGINTASYEHAADDGAGGGVTASLTDAATNTGDASGDAYSNIQNLLGSAFNDTLTGDAANNVLTGGGGNDSLVGMAGVDTLVGGDGNDSLTDDGVGVALLDGGAGDDTVILTARDGSWDTYTGGSGVDTLVWSGPANSRMDVNLELGGNLGYVEGTITSRASGTGFENVTVLGNCQTYVYMSNADNMITGGSTTNDWVDYRYATAGIVADLAATGVNVTGGSGNDTLIGIDNILYGSHFNDRLTGNANNNDLQGGAGADYLDGGAGVDRVRYDYWDGGGPVTVSLMDAATNNTLGIVFTSWAAGDQLFNFENIYSSNYGDTLYGDGNSNAIWGVGGDDTLQGMGGGDYLDGGGGTDTASYSLAGSSAAGANTTGVGTGVTATLTGGLGVNNAGDAAGDTYAGIENLTGSGYGDMLVGSSGVNVLSGGAGDDVLEGLAGADILNGGAGNDTASYAHASGTVLADLGGVYANTGDATGDVFVQIENLTGSAFADTLYGNSADNVLSGGGGNDLLDGGAGTDTASYAAATAAVTINLATSTVSGNASVGTDTLVSIERIVGSAYNDTVTGSGGDDLIEGGLGADTMDGGAGTDTLSYAAATGFRDVVLNGANTEGDVLSNFENLVGSTYGDVLTGDAGDNVIEGGLGNDALDGGANGAAGDTASYAGASAAVVASLVAGTASGGAGNDTLSNFEHLTGTNYNDTLTGDGSVNVLNGGAGNDLLQGGAGADALNGGSGTDTASYAGAGAAVAVMINGAGTVGDANGDTLSSIENLVGSAYNDTLTGDALANVIDGGLGNDAINGGGGIDTVTYASATALVTVDLSSGGANVAGGAGNDSLSNFENIVGSGYNDTLTGDGNDNVIEGGNGADLLNGGAGGDTASYAGSGVGVNVSLLVGAANTGGDAASDVLSNFENLLGSAFNDTLIGNAAANVVDGGAGDDTLLGGVGADQLVGGAGSDTASYATSAAAVTASLTSNTGTQGDANGDTFSGIENLTGGSAADTLTGDANNNVLAGGAGNDWMSGADGNDTLDARSGKDTAYGGNGDDLFLVDAASANLPTWVQGDGNGDINSGGDTLRLSGLSAGSYSLTGLANVTQAMEKLDIRDGLNTALGISSADVRNFVDAGNGSRIFVKADAGDTISINTVAGETVQTVSLGAGQTDYLIFNAVNTQVAQIHWQTA